MLYWSENEHAEAEEWLFANDPQYRTPIENHKRQQQTSAAQTLQDMVRDIQRPIVVLRDDSCPAYRWQDIRVAFADWVAFHYPALVVSEEPHKIPGQQGRPQTALILRPPWSAETEPVLRYVHGIGGSLDYNGADCIRVNMSAWRRRQRRLPAEGLRQTSL